VDQAIASLKAVTSTKGEVSGRLRLTVPTVAASQVLAVVLPRFIERYPEVDIEIRVEDRFIDAVAEGFDAGIRLVEAIDRDMVHVQLTGEARVVVAGAPSYFERAGVPQAPADLQRHICVNSRMAVTGAPFPWEFERGKKTWKVNVHGPVSVNNFELNKSLAISGVGLLYCLEPSIAGELARASSSAWCSSHMRRRFQGCFCTSRVARSSRRHSRRSSALRVSWRRSRRRAVRARGRTTRPINRCCADG
jgi:DNA-binding transcriptional LysR family regulator